MELNRLEEWIDCTLKEYLDIADGIDILKNLKKEEREEQYQRFRELYNAGIIGTVAESELGMLQWEALDELPKLSKDFNEKLLEKIRLIAPKKNVPKEELKKENRTSKKEELTLDYLIDLAHSYLNDASHFVLTEVGMESTTPREFLEALRIIYAQERHDEDALAFLEVSADYLLNFVNSPDGLKYGAKGLYEFLDLIYYLQQGESNEKPN